MNFNEDFKRQLRLLLPQEADALLEALGEEPSVSVRVNGRKAEAAVPGCPVPWCGGGFYLASRPQFTFDPLFHAGMYYVQDASSMFVCHVLKSLDLGDVDYLDLCAAPGGKTTAAIGALSEDSLVVSNEIDTLRAQILRENVVKWGMPNCVVASDRPRSFGKMKHFFDVIAADMPCSGEGMFRKDAEAVAQWTPALVEQCAARQKEIVDDVWSALKPGGIFIYSTCTFNRRENEDVVDYIVSTYGAESVDIPVEDAWNIHRGIGTPHACFRFLPHRTQGEGLFVAVLRKPGESGRAVALKTKTKKKAAPVPENCMDWLRDSEKFTFTVAGDEVAALPCELSVKMNFLAENVNVIHSGIRLASLKGKGVVPAHALSQSRWLNRGSFPCVEVDYPAAVAYLRAEAFRLDPDVPRGYVLIAYRGIPLGFMKNIGNRANNLYPKEWRIRSSFVPDAVPSVLSGEH